MRDVRAVQYCQYVQKWSGWKSRDGGKTPLSRTPRRALLRAVFVVSLLAPPCHNNPRRRRSHAWKMCYGGRGGGLDRVGIWLFDDRREGALLDNAVGLMGNSTEPKSAVKAHIRAMAAKHGLKLPAKWQAKDAKKLVAKLNKQMREYAKIFEFERAAMLRDQLFELRASLTRK